MASLVSEAFCARLDEIYGVRLEPTDTDQMAFAAGAAQWLAQASAEAGDPHKKLKAAAPFPDPLAPEEWHNRAQVIAEDMKHPRLAAVAKPACQLFRCVMPDPLTGGVDFSVEIGRAAADCLHAWAAYEAAALAEAQRVLAG